MNNIISIVEKDNKIHKKVILIISLEILLLLFMLNKLTTKDFIINILFIPLFIALHEFIHILKLKAIVKDKVKCNIFISIKRISISLSKNSFSIKRNDFIKFIIYPHIFILIITYLTYIFNIKYFYLCGLVNIVGSVNDIAMTLKLLEYSKLNKFVYYDREIYEYNDFISNRQF